MVCQIVQAHYCVYYEILPVCHGYVCICRGSLWIFRRSRKGICLARDLLLCRVVLYGQGSYAGIYFTLLGMDNVIVHGKRDRPLWIAWVFAIMLFIIPFFWFSPGEADLGGDGTRLFFYDPWSYIKNYSLAAIAPSGRANEIIGYQTLPFVFFIAIIRFVISSPTYLAALVHGFTLSLSFFAIYCILITLMRPSVYGIISHLGAIAGGILYALSPNLVTRWDRMLMSQTDIFVFPLVYYFLLKFFQNNLFRYVIGALIITSIFSQNFSYVGAPGFFSFFPLAFISFLGYKKYVLSEKIPWRSIGLGLLLFLGLHAYHILPTMLTTFTKNSQLNLTIFSKAQSLGWGLQYFSGIAKDVKVSYGFLLLPQLLVSNLFQKLLLIIPCVIFIGGFILTSHKLASSKEKRLYLLYSCFFIITLFFATANITHTGVAFYALLFQIPGFSMFRAFFEQWSISQAFYTTVIFGISGIIIAHYVSFKRSVYSRITIFFVLFVLVLSFPFLLGNNVRQILWKSSDVPVGIRVPSNFDLAVRSTTPLGSQAKFITFPLTDHGWQMVLDANGHGYMGPSFLSFVAGVQDFTSLGEMGFASKLLSQALRYRDYETVNRMLGLLNIRYIFINNDERVFTLFPTFPYEEIKKIVGHSRADYETLLAGLHAVKQADFGQYSIYQLPNQYFFPRVFAVSSVTVFDTPLADWNIPFLTQPTRTSPFIVADSEKSLPLATEYFIEATMSPTVIDEIEKDVLSQQLSYSYARIRPGSLLYPLVSLYETVNARFSKCSKFPLRCVLLKASKRLYEMETWGSQIGVIGNVDARTVKDVQVQESLWMRLKSFKSISWETMMVRYRDIMMAAIELSQIQQGDEQIKDKYFIYEFLLSHQQRMSAIIQHFAYPDDTKKYLMNLSNETFDVLHQQLNLPDVTPSALIYRARIDDFLHDINTQYIVTQRPNRSVVIDPQFTNSFLSNTYSVLYADQQFQVENSQGVQSNPLPMDRPSIPNDSQVRFLIDTYDNLFAHAQSTTNASTVTTSDAGITILNFNNSPEAITWRVGSIARMGDYLVLSFQFRTRGSIFFLHASTTQQNLDGTSTKRAVITDMLSSGTWRTYRRVIRLTDEDQAIDISIKPEGSTTNSQIEFVDQKLVHVPLPRLFLKFELPPYTYQLPTVGVTKINSGTYKAHVENASNPYYLVLNQEYSPRWNVQIVGEDGKQYPVAIRHHYRVNGNANAWYIDPGDVQGKNTYTLVIENSVQIYFRLGAVISIIVCLGMIIVSVFLYIFKKNGV